MNTNHWGFNFHKNSEDYTNSYKGDGILTGLSEHFYVFPYSVKERSVQLTKENLRLGPVMNTGDSFEEESSKLHVDTHCHINWNDFLNNMTK